MTVTLSANEFPTLDLDQLDACPARPAVVVPAIDRDELPALLAAHLPTVVHARRRTEQPLVDEHQFIDTATGDAVRYVLTVNHRDQTITATVAESQPHGLWDRLVVLCGDWERANRPKPEAWSR